ncbi:MAG: spore cortex biosynthesis protein YabQ [Christensenellaceae bacterium]|nr:spore cortex biosynthesis protein YabQ [Christensenellaceae bacterium]
MSLHNTTLDQPFVFAAFLYAGILIGLLHTLFRGIARIFGRRKLIEICADLLFLAISGLLVIYLSFRITGMKLRGYYLFGVLTGYMLYSTAIQPLAKWLNCKFRKKKIDNSRSK